ncbi:MAG: SDR family oxidoreductase [Spirochaetes bacterium]|nr:SDR family oxidoreductase [Spirochaetota bacterium]
MTKRVLITGGAGFIGSHLCRYFLEKGYNVIALDNFITGKKENIKSLLNHKQFTFIKHDITKPIKFKDRINYILHFASPASPIDYLQYPIQTLKVGALGTYICLGVALSHKARMLLASTSEVYGDPLVHPQPESYWGHVNPIGPRGVYDEAKRYAEAITMAYQRYHKVDTRIVRIFNTYGERMRLNDGRAVPNFIYQALHNKAITVYGKGDQTRSFCYVSDLVEGIYSLLLSNIKTPVNIGNPFEMSILEFAKKIKEMTSSKSRIIFKDLPLDDPKIRKPDISLAKKKLNWKPVVSFETGLTRTIDWFRNSI